MDRAWKAHPVHFVREQLGSRGYMPCRALREAHNGARIAIAGIVLVRQMPGSAKGVMFVTLEDESANANLIVWPKVFEKNRRAILAATMMGVRGRVQYANDVIHLVVEEVSDLSAVLRYNRRRRKAISGAMAGRGDEAIHGGHGPDSRDPKPAPIKPRDMYEPDLHIDTLKEKARNFR